MEDKFKQNEEFYLDEKQDTSHNKRFINIDSINFKFFGG